MINEMQNDVQPQGEECTWEFPIELTIHLENPETKEVVKLQVDLRKVITLGVRPIRKTIEYRVWDWSIKKSWINSRLIFRACEELGYIPCR